MYNSDFTQNMNMDSNITGNNNYVEQNMDVDVNNHYGNIPMVNSNGIKERVINRTFIHEVPQDCFFMIEK